MEVDTSSRFRQPTQSNYNQFSKKRGTSRTKFFGNSSLLPFVERTIAGKTIKFLIDTGASKHYIKPIPELKDVIKVKNMFQVKSLHGFTSVKDKCRMYCKVVPRPGNESQSDQGCLQENL